MTTPNYIRISIMEIRTLELLNEIKGLIQDKVSDRWLCIRDVCEYASVSESTVRRAVRKGSLKASHSTGKLLFKVSSVDRWLKG